MTSTIWEEAENEFYQEAFYRDKNSSTLDSNQSTFDRTTSIATVIHRPTLHSGGSLQGTAGGGPGGGPGGGTGVSKRTNGKKGTRTRSERMRAAIQGLASEDSDGTEGLGEDFGGSDVFISGKRYVSSTIENI